MYGKEYRESMENQSFSHDFQEKTVRAMSERKPKRRGGGPLFTAVAAILAIAVTFAALSLPNGAGSSALSAYALNHPVYPEMPTMPQYDENGDSRKYHEQINAYYTALEQVRHGFDPVSELTRDIMNDFTVRSTSLILSEQVGENIVYSPLSLWSALAMLSRCAEGNSRQQVLDALGVASVEEVDAQVEHLWRKLYTEDGVSSLRFANSVWLNESLNGSYVQKTLDTLAQKHFAGSYAVPMGTTEADKAVTSWVSEQTKGLIGADQPVTETKKETLALLVSSLYYKASWLDEFRKSNNTEDIFTCADNTENKATFMHRTTNANFLRRTGYQAAWLPTHLGSVTFVLPDEGVAPEDLLSDPSFLASLDNSSEDALYGKIEWSVPKFDVSSSLDLLNALKDMGITDVMDFAAADLSGISTLPSYISGASQLARVKVDEVGVEAAAVTIITDSATSAPTKPEEVCVMDLDRPFLFVIRYEGITLFVGIVNQI